LTSSADSEVRKPRLIINQAKTVSRLFRAGLFCCSHGWFRSLSPWPTLKRSASIAQYDRLCAPGAIECRNSGGVGRGGSANIPIAESYLRYAWKTAASCSATRSCPTAGRRIAKWPRQSIKRVFRIIPFVRQILRVQKSLVDRVPQLAGSEFMKFTDDPTLKLISGPIAQAGYDDGLGDLRPRPNRFDEFPVHPRRQVSRICRASGRGSFRLDQMSVHPSVPALADITHNAIHDDRINVTAGRSPSRDSPSR
jgi:hypothetical protein